jgi:hypothetical protein
MKQLNWYQIFGNTKKIPDGRTVTPTDDIQIWLHCANIWDKTYTTLAEVLTDTDTLLALITSNNAVDYMVRSTTWASYTSVPKMTSYNTPSGRVLYSGSPSLHEAWQAFDKNESQDGNGNWEKTFSSGDYIGYTFTEPVCVSSFRLVNPNWNSVVLQRCIKNFKLQGSNDGNTWTDIESYTNEQVLEKVFSVNNSDSYTSYRLYITSNYGNSYVLVIELQFYSQSIVTSETAMTYIGQNNYCANTLLADATWCNAICNSTYFERVLNVKVPKMTGTTTPSGEVLFSTEDSTARAWKAFDEITASDNRWTSLALPAYIGYDFTEPVSIVFVTMVNRSATAVKSPKNVELQTSEDKSTWNTTQSYVNTNNAVSATTKYIAPNSTKARYHRWYITSANDNATNNNIAELQFYGRKDI